MQLQSPAFPDDGDLPVRYSRDGQNSSPPLKWSDVPERARELALIFECTTPSTREPYVQWLAYEIPSDTEGLPEGYKHKAEPGSPGEIKQGTNDAGNVGYDGPLGTATQAYRYRFVLFALDRPVGAGPGLTKQQLLDAMDGHVIAKAELQANYTRPRG